MWLNVLDCDNDIHFMGATDFIHFIHESFFFFEKQFDTLNLLNATQEFCKSLVKLSQDGITFDQL